MRYFAENGKADIWQDTPQAIDRSPDDLKKQSSTPVRRGRQPEMSGQLGGSLMSLKCQSNLLNCTSVGAFANVPS